MNQTAFPLLQTLQSAGSQSADRLMKLMDGGLEGVDAEEFRHMLESALADLGIEAGELDLAADGNSLPPLASLTDSESLDGQEAVAVLERLMAFVGSRGGNVTAGEPASSGRSSASAGNTGGASPVSQNPSQSILLSAAAGAADMDNAREGNFQRLMLLNSNEMANLDRQALTAGGNGESRQAIQSINAQQFAALTSTASQSGEVSSMNRMPPIQSPVGGQAWGEALGQRILMMKGQGMDRAEVRLNPPQLGPLEIRLSVTQDQTSLLLSSQNALTRDALEQALPRLREMFDARGLAMGDAQVNDGSRHGQTDGGGDGRGSDSRESPGSGAALAEGGVNDSAADETIQVGLLDEYV